jgi:hypothetical protein
MKRSRVQRFVIIAALASPAIAACGDDVKPTETTTPTQIPNPASEFCVKQGGTVAIVDEAGGQVGYCNLPDGTRVEEWAYFRAQTGTTTLP